MARFKFRRAPRFENLESRQLLSTGVTSQGPTNDEQLMLQLLNQARTDPAAAAHVISENITPDITATLNYYGVNLQSTLNSIASATPQPPLAWNADLAQAAQGHSQDMSTNQFQSHTGSDGSSPGDRIQAAGYTNSTSTGENVYAYSTSVEEAMEAFLLDWGVSDDGHRMNIQQMGVSADGAYRDVGIGIVSTSGTSSVGPLVVTQDFGAQANEQAQVVGVAYNDPNNTGFYAAGEGVGNVQITAVNLATGAVSSTQTWSSGGYELSLAPGQYQLIASQNNEVFNSSKVTVGSVNIEQDYVLTNTWQGGSLQSAISAAQPAPKPTPTPTPSAPVASVMAVATPQSTQTQVSTPAASAITWNWTSWSASSASSK
jgi:uncharacterized protein YkwD